MPSWGPQIRLCPHQKQVQSMGCPKELKQGNLQAAG